MENNNNNNNKQIDPIAERVEHKASIEYENFQHQIVIAETLRQLLTDSLEWPIDVQLEARMNIGEHCGIAGIKTSSIKCDPEEFEALKMTGEL
jgi:hypothetical protein